MKVSFLIALFFIASFAAISQEKGLHWRNVKICVFESEKAPDTLDGCRVWATGESRFKLRQTAKTLSDIPAGKLNRLKKKTKKEGGGADTVYIDLHNYWGFGYKTPYILYMKKYPMNTI